MAQPSVLTRILFVVLCGLASLAAANVADDVKRLIRAGNYVEAEQLLIVRSRAGDADSSYQLARLYARQLVAPPSEGSAHQLFELAARDGHVEAMFQVGKHYERGHTVNKDIDRAREWYKRADAHEHPRAARALAGLPPTATSTVAKGSLIEAVRACRTDLVRGFVHGQQDISDGTSLFLALECDSAIDIVRLLISAGVPLNHVDGAGNLALHRAVARNQADVARLLLTQGADPLRRNREGWSARMLAERADDDRIQAVFDIKSSSRDVSLQQLEQAGQSERFASWSPLNIAAWQGNTEAVGELLRNGASLDADATQRTALYRALERRHLDVVELLLSHGAPLTADDTTLIFALEDSVLLNALVKAAAASGHAQPLGCAAIAHEKTDALSFLSSQGWQADQPCNGQAALVWFAKQGSLKGVQLLAAMEHDVDVADDQGCTALCWALRKGHVELAHLLVDQGAGNHPDNRGVSPLMVAARTGDSAAVKLLVERGARVNAQSRSGSHALLLAATAGYADIVSYLLSQGAEIDKKNNVGDTALIAAVRADQFDAASVLLERGASMRAHNERFESAREMVDAKADPRWTKLFSGKEGIWKLVNRD